MKRREFIAGLGGSAAAWPLAARAQQAAIPLVGFMSSGEPGPEAPFRQGLKDRGFVEGQNVAVEYRYVQNRADRLPELAADLVRRNVAVIAAIGGTRVAAAAKAATSTIPIIFEVGTDPVQYGLVASLNRPGGNITGVNSMIGDVWPKAFDLMAKLRPNSQVFAILITGPQPPNRPEQVRQEAQSAAVAIGRKVLVMEAGTPQDIDVAFPTLARQGVEALVVSSSPLAYDARVQLAVLAARYAIPAIYAFRENAAAGGLMSYGINIDESMRLVGDYVGRVLKGERPSDLPVQRPTRFQFIINLQTARALGIDVPPTLLALADEVIE